MAGLPFAELVGELTETFGQQMGSSRRTEEGLRLRTTDGFLYAFVERPDAVDEALVARFLSETPGGPRRLVVFVRSELPADRSAALRAAGATVVEGPRFSELVHSLGLGRYLGEEPRPEPSRETRRLLPSAQRLDSLMHRARTWQEWGVPALALRFYHQAAELKPGFLPARTGVAVSFLSLGLAPEARQAYEAVLAADPQNPEARIGLAAVLGLEGQPEAEIAAYRALIAEVPEQISFRAHLVAALLDHQRWAEARAELDVLTGRLPEDPRLRFLHAVTLEKTGAEAERELSLQLGLTSEPPVAAVPPARTGPPASPEGAAPPRRGAGTSRRRASRQQT
jgi:tetratricopeptide (TPR) repeat protein